jgi:hypothetical protein
LWHQRFHDRGAEYRRMLVDAPSAAPLAAAG